MPKRKQKQKNEIKASRPPIVAVLGHVDHGKTTLLDYIRKTKVAAQEQGGITQTIGAYQVDIVTKDGERQITFIDTPGHEAFTKMRSRGAQVADIAVLVVAANDGVMPQTVEAINHIQAANIPFLVAINKIDLPAIDIDRVKRQLTKHKVLIEGYGGDTVVVPISAKTGKGIDELLEMILLVSDLVGFSADKEHALSAVVIESGLDRQRGPIATVVVKDGSLSIADRIQAETTTGRVRSMTDELGKQIKKAYPGKAVEIVGWNKVPPVGAKVTRVIEDSQKKVASRQESKTIRKKQKKESILNIMVKAKSQGALEAIQQMLPPGINVVSAGVGDISESDILFAKTTESILIGYGTKVLSAAAKLSETEEVIVKTEDVIYRLIDEINEVIEALKEGALEEILGKAEILKEFVIKKRRIAGVKVSNGRLAKGDKVKLMRDGEEIARNTITSLRAGKQDVSQVEAPKECGVGFSNQSPLDFKVGDTIISYRK